MSFATDVSEMHTLSACTCGAFEGGDTVLPIPHAPGCLASLSPPPAAGPYPDGNPKTVMGMKKPGFSAIPPSALLHLGAAMADGRRKYGAMNWREQSVTASVYYDAAIRHLGAWFDGDDLDVVSKVHHLGHAMACCAILLDAAASGKLNDDRIPGPFQSVVDQMAASIAGKQTSPA